MDSVVQLNIPFSKAEISSWIEYKNKNRLTWKEFISLSSNSFIENNKMIENNEDDVAMITMGDDDQEADLLQTNPFKSEDKLEDESIKFNNEPIQENKKEGKTLWDRFLA